MKLKNVVGTFLVVVFGFSSVFKTTYAEASDDIVFFHTDILGSAVAAVNEQGDLCWHESYSPYGEKVFNDDVLPGVGMPAGCGLLGDERGFTSHTQDYESNLVYAQQRYYDPSIGRFLAIDPINVNPENVETINRYSYAFNNPYRYTDPTGLYPTDYDAENYNTYVDDPLSNEIELGISTGFGVRSEAHGFYDSDNDDPYVSLTQEDLLNIMHGSAGYQALSIGSTMGAGLFSGGLKGFFGRLFGRNTPAAVGKAGELAVQNMYEIGLKKLITINGRNRIPDGLTATTLSEVKNVKGLSFTQQLRDFSDYARNNGLKFELYVRPTTKLSGPLMKQIESGNISLRLIPGVM